MLINSEFPNKPASHTFWRHYKSSGWEDYTYEVLGIVYHTETQEEMVLYKMLYDADREPGKEAHQKGTHFVRPLSMWYNIIEWNGKKVQRFTQIENV